MLFNIFSFPSETLSYKKVASTALAFKSDSFVFNFVAYPQNWSQTPQLWTLHLENSHHCQLTWKSVSGGIFFKWLGLQLMLFYEIARSAQHSESLVTKRLFIASSNILTEAQLSATPFQIDTAL